MYLYLIWGKIDQRGPHPDRQARYFSGSALDVGDGEAIVRMVCLTLRLNKLHVFFCPSVGSLQSPATGKPTNAGRSGNYRVVVRWLVGEPNEGELGISGWFGVTHIS